LRDKRKRLAHWLDRAGVLEVLLRIGTRSGVFPWLPVLNYHRVVDDAVRTTTPFDHDLMVSPEQFDRQVGFLKRHFTLVGVDELCAFARGGECPKNAIAITFDDGYADNRRVALPILQRHGAKATFFIATDYLTNRRVFWWDRICYIVKRSAKEALELSYPRPLRFDLRSADGRAQAQRTLLTLVKHHFNLDIWRFLDELTTASGVEWNAELERRYADELLMTWDEVRELQKAGMSIGSHTRWHRVLKTMPADDLADELGESRRILEEQIGQPVQAVAYPAGDSIAGTPIVDAVRAAGYQIGFSSCSGLNRRRQPVHPFDLNRLSVEVELTPSQFRGFLLLPFLDPRQSMM
jgi:peptidoglycan/xylan/chitin deacetylase (PgdA/CDA1 family)